MTRSNDWRHNLMTWPAPDRAVIGFPDLAAVTARQAQVGALVACWVQA